MLHRNFASLGYVEQSEVYGRSAFKVRTISEGHEGGSEKDWDGFNEEACGRGVVVDSLTSFQSEAHRVCRKQSS
jgi:hypothetical protein